MAVIHKRYWVERCGTVGAVAICSKNTRHVFRSWEACKESKWPFWHLTRIPEDIHRPETHQFIDPLQEKAWSTAKAENPLQCRPLSGNIITIKSVEDYEKLFGPGSCPDYVKAWMRGVPVPGRIIGPVKIGPSTVWAAHMNANDCRDNAARKWYYETQVQPRWKKESK